MVVEQEPELRITRLEQDVKTILSNQATIIDVLQHVATQDDIARLEARMDRLEARMDALEERILTVLERIEQRLTALDERVAALEGKA